MGVYYVALGLFVAGSTALTVWTWMNTRRLRNRMMSWHDSGITKWPVFPSLFVALCVAAIAVNALMGRHDFHVYEACYLWTGLNWMASYRMMGKRHITDYGIVKNINDPSQTIAWHQINDYLEQERPGATEFTFFFVENGGDGLRSHRIRLNVPADRYETFRRILTYKVDRHLTYTSYAASDKERTS